MNSLKNQVEKIRGFYDNVYYENPQDHDGRERHLKNLANRLNIGRRQKILDVACGNGQWLRICHQKGARVSGIDISQRAIETCKARIPEGEFFTGRAESLPFDDQRFDWITCLGALEHFMDPGKSLDEMVRVAKPDAKILLLVPNADFLTRKLGFFSGTSQIEAREEVLPLEQWRELFERHGLLVTQRWRDLHILSRHWICRGGFFNILLRALQAAALIVWPLKWQYQVHHLCRKSNRVSRP